MIYNVLEKYYKIIIDNSNDVNFNKELFNLCNDINNIFKNSNTDIKNALLKKKIVTRTNKLTFVNVLCYVFNYSFIDLSKQSVVSNYNYDNKINVNRTSFYKKELKIPLSFYQNTFLKIKNLLNKYLNKNNDDFNIIAVDGTYSNTNIYNDKKLETCLNMGYYDCSNSLPIEIEIKGTEYKNCEIKSFIEFIKKNKFDSKNVILVLDRAYFSYDLIDILNEYKLNFVIRVRNNCSCIKNEQLIENKIKVNNVRFINYSSIRRFIIEDKEGKDVKLEEKLICNLVTNLPLIKYNDDQIKNIYLQRWDVEVFFKLLKSNFKFAYLREHTKNTIEQYKKKYFVILINLYLMRLIECVYDKNKKHKTKTKDKNKHKYNIRNNDTLMIEGLKKIINSIINSSINYEQLNNYCNCYIKNNYSILNISNPRKSNIPFAKWYIKSYSKYNEYIQIINALKNNDLTTLNKNLKTMASNIKIYNG